MIFSLWNMYAESWDKKEVTFDGGDWGIGEIEMEAATDLLIEPESSDLSLHSASIS
jgi:hypothetical protein